MRRARSLKRDTRKAKLGWNKTLPLAWLYPFQRESRSSPLSWYRFWPRFRAWGLAPAPARETTDATTCTLSPIRAAPAQLRDVRGAAAGPSARSSGHAHSAPRPGGQGAGLGRGGTRPRLGRSPASSGRRQCRIAFQFSVGAKKNNFSPHVVSLRIFLPRVFFSLYEAR